ncbi:hypothetical protein QQP08_009823 [Theobroma cacao]|nr:hypothetical protein QQP08_009823 [Theobroma cacao]
MQQRQLQQGVDDGYCGPQLVIPSIRQSCNAVSYRRSLFIGQRVKFVRSRLASGCVLPAVAWALSPPDALTAAPTLFLD